MNQKLGLEKMKVMLLRLSPIVFQKSSHPIGFRPPYILKYAQALLEEEGRYCVNFIDQRITDLSSTDILGIVSGWSPHVIVLATTTLDSEESLEFCKNVKKIDGELKIPIIGVGQEVSVDSSKCGLLRKEFNIVLAGEAELEIVRIIEQLRSGININIIAAAYDCNEMKPITLSVKDLDAMPFPRYTLKDLKKYGHIYPIRMAKRLIWGHMLSSRGCPHHCVFCSNIMRESYGKEFRGRSSARVVDEIQHLQRSGANIIIFDDDNFTTNRRHVESLCEEILSRKVNVKWVSHARADEVDVGLLKLMKRAGCVLLRYGVESGSERIIDRFCKTRDSHTWLSKCYRAIFQTKACGISVACFFIIGSPGETREDFLKSIKVAKDLSPDIIQIAYFVPFPGSSIYRSMREVDKEKSGKSYHYLVPSVNFSDMNFSEIRYAQDVFYKRFLLRPTFLIRHIFVYLLFYIKNPYIFCRFFRKVALMKGN